MLLNCDSVEHADILERERLYELSEAFIDIFAASSPILSGKRAQKKADERWKVVRKVVERIAKDKMRRTRKNDTLLYPDAIDLYIESRKGDVLLEDIIGQTMLIVIAGHATTASILSSFAAYTTTRPDLVSKLRAEQSSFKDDHTKTADPQSQQPFPLLEATFREIERLESPVPALRRIANEDVRFFPSLHGHSCGPFVIKKGTFVSIDIASTNRDPEVYEDPDRFIPERWLRDKQAGGGLSRVSSSACTMLTFGAGPRLCLGREFARMEMTVIGSVMLRNFDWSRHEGKIEKTTFPIAEWSGGVRCYLDEI
ncbi:hypothetical protein HDU67_000358 [Dinochytrium kinnereticum]|nr:hypothetical protein HDU67_000358 [Dinochytrium kinnereticum]